MMICVTLLILAAASVLHVPAQPDLIASAWSTDYDAAVEQARAAGLPLLIVLEDGHQPTNPLYSLNSSGARAQGVLLRYRLCRLDVKSEMGQRIAEGYNASQFPYTLITDVRCERIVFRGAGSFSQGAWQSTLTKFAGPHAAPEKGLSQRSSRPQPDAVDGESADEELDGLFAAFDREDLREALSTAERRQRPLLAYITMEGCHFCELMRQQTLQEEDVQAAVARTFESVIVHREEEGAWIDQFDIRIYPTTLLIARDGSVLDRLEGFVPPAEFLGRLQRNELPTLSAVW